MSRGRRVFTKSKWGGRKLLSFRSNGKPDTVVRYTDKNRPSKKFNYKFSAKVNEAMYNVMEDTNIENGADGITAGTKRWIGFEVGREDNLLACWNRANSHHNGYGVADPNATGFQRMQNKIRVLQEYSKVDYFNNSTCKQHISVYHCELRRDITSVLYNPLDLILGGNQDGQLMPSPPNMTAGDVRFTPYMCPSLTQMYKISKVRSFVLAAGAPTKFFLQNGNFKWGPHLEVTNGTNPYFARKGTYKVILISIHGELGCVSDTEPSTHIRHLSAK